ncbi:MAG: FMN-binding protein [Gammaproteobacteria bacterium]|nr:FMN-binding protein [Gammaproteobacteria bacterium]
MRILFATLLSLLLTVQAAWAGGTYQTPEDFLSEVFAGTTPEPSVLWLTGEVRAATTKILGHEPNQLRVRYWTQGQRSAWILDEIGKEQPITTGYVVNAGQIEQVRVLIFRESRGWEVKYPFFTDQFMHIGLTPELKLNKQIDGVSGATLSVRALTNLARLALYLHQQIPMAGHDAP